MKQQADEDSEEEEEESGEEEEDGDGEVEDQESELEIDTRLQDGTLLPPSAIDTIGRGHGRQSRKSKDPNLPSKGAAAKAAAEGDDRGIKDRIAAERQRKAAKESKHHGKKAHSGKAGRTWAPGSGGKAKTSDKALVFNSLHF